jgi:hypothetical protein
VNELQPAARPAPRLLILLIAAVVFVGVISSFASWIALLIYLPYACVGGLLAIQRPRNPIGWLLIGIGWALLSGFQSVPATSESLQGATAPPLVMLVAWQKGWSWLGGFGLFVVITVLFPSGHLPPGRWRTAGLATILAAWLAVAIISLAPTIPAGVTDRSVPIEIINPAAAVVPEPLFSWLAALTPVGVIVLLAALLVGAG